MSSYIYYFNGSNIRKVSKYFFKKKVDDCSGEKTFQSFQGLRINPALHFLPPPLHANQPGLSKLLDVMGNRRGYNFQILTEFTHTGASRLPCTGINTGDRSRQAAGGQAHENFQAVRVGKGLEHLGKFFNVFISTVRHISKI